MLTTEDWIKRAREGAEVVPSLTQAEKVARSPDDWLQVATAWLDHGDAASARGCVERCLELAQGEHWITRQVAELLLARFGDREAAVAALGRLEAQLSSPRKKRPVQTDKWIQLARAYQDVLGQEDSVRRCLASASATARQAKDLASLAVGYAEFLQDPAGARELLERAERLARERGEYRELWAIAVAWRGALGDDVRARAALTIATAETSDVHTLTSLTIPWRSLFYDEEALRGALVRGESLAKAPGDWLALAEGYRDGGDGKREAAWDPEGVRRCLEAALVATPAPTDEERSEIAAAFRRWLGDPTRAAELVPTQLTPESILVPLRHLEGWDARDPRAILHRLRAMLTRDDLSEIAAADYGADQAKHLQALLEIQATGLFPIPLEWYPRAVLEHTRRNRGEGTHHARRAFACALLALDLVLPGTSQGEDLDDALAPLVESAWALGLDAELEQLLVWLAEVVEARSVFGSAWAPFALILTLARRAPKDSRLDALAEAFEAAEAAVSDLDFIGTVHSRITAGDRGQAPLWRELIAEVLVPGRGLPPRLERLGRLE
jgi:hypothetical protein